MESTTEMAAALNQILEAQVDEPLIDQVPVTSAPVPIPSLQAVQVIQSSDPGAALYTLPDEDLQRRIERCLECKGIGYFRRDLQPGQTGFGTLYLCETCGSLQRELARRMRLLRLGSLIEKYSTCRGDLLTRTFSGYDTSTKGVRAGYNAIVRWVHRAAGEGDGPLWLYLWGPVGTGKTHLAAAAANYLHERRIPVVMTTMPRLLGMVRAADWNAKEELLTHLGEMPILILDDVAAEHGTSWTEEQLFQIVDTRYNLRLPTLIVSNLSPGDIGHARVASRVQDKAIGEVVPVKGSDYRQGKSRSETAQHPTS